MHAPHPSRGSEPATQDSHVGPGRYLIRLWRLQREGRLDRRRRATIPLPTPRSRRHHVHACIGDHCPRCGSRDTRPWGGFSGRRRFRCRGCGRTFSTFTGTPLHYLKRIDRWPEFTRCVDEMLPLRRTARRLSVHPSTAFRWRHRLLADWRRRDGTALTGRVAMGRAWFAHSEKGQKPVGRAPRRRGYRYFSHIPRELRVQVPLAWQRDDATLAEVSRPGDDHPSVPARALFPRFARIEKLFAGRLPLEGLDAVAAAGGVHVVRQWPIDRGVSPTTTMERRLRRWLRPFRGVATRYLPHYLQWFRSDLAEGRPSAYSPPRLPRWMRGPAPATAPTTVPANRSRGWSRPEEGIGWRIRRAGSRVGPDRDRAARAPP